ncbi:GNAT family N-acetyltransferase [Sphingobacterium alkalisoli]|uniref:GNAT family N-acetyltransferase n=1 Tax=Sphingobacterium alkalisoli TaxID=1874115 RepID=A0A4U0H5S7_9SPHI|nr:GNAT family N-acetyltransferase [Sphingobacterium alkalisoli]TJY67123.1 GNAT family N-acetyltransferase [Sphingobacterium alkalisoli]GGH12064.1 hypothetical protein GCM10011418_11350 [Sphingobacterium alkalisoli]
MKKQKLHQLSLPAYSVEKSHDFLRYRKEVGYSAYECSFLLGKHDFFIRNIENLLHKSSFSTIDTNYISLIFREIFGDIFPAIAFNGNYAIRIEHTTGLKRKPLYEIKIEEVPGVKTSTSYSVQEEDKHIELQTKLELKDEQTLKDFIFSLCNNGFFNHARTALEIFDECRKEENFGANFHPRNMIKALNHYTNSKSGEPILDNSRTNLFSRRLFFRPIDFAFDHASGTISKEFGNIGLSSFRKAAEWVSNQPYRRNSDKDSPLCLFEENAGTCSTKHAVLKRLADENGNTELKLILGIFSMNGKNTPAIKGILKKYNLKYIPEAHNYFRAHKYILDFTGIGINETKLELDLLEEIEIQANQTTGFKISYHRDYLAKWMEENKISHSPEELWKVREECIRAITLARLEQKTERLLLRPFKKEDGAIMYALNDDKDVLQYTGDVQFADVSTAEEFFDKYDQYEKYSVGRMVVILKETGEVLGWCGLKYDSASEEYDIGYRFFKKYWNNGYATESAKAILEEGFGRLAIKRVVGRARIENTASIRVFEKLEMTFVKKFLEDGENWVLYEVTPNTPEEPSSL